MGRFALILLLFLAGCSEITKNETDSRGSCIYVSILDSRGVKIYSEELPLIYVQQMRDITTNQYNDYTFTFNIPDNWNILFESETISFSCIGTDEVPLNWLPSTYYQFSITTAQ